MTVPHLEGEYGTSREGHPVERFVTVGRNGELSYTYITHTHIQPVINPPVPEGPPLSGPGFPVGGENRPDRNVDEGWDSGRRYDD